MSLRDALLKAGTVTQKDVRRVNQQQQAERQQQKGSRESREEAEKRAAEEARAAKEARSAELIATRRARAQAVEREAMRRRVGNLLRDYQQRTRGGNQPFWHRAADGSHIHRMYLNERLAWDLVHGRLAIAWTGSPEDPTYVLLPRAVVERVAALEPGRILFFNETSPSRDDPSEQLY